VDHGVAVTAGGDQVCLAEYGGVLAGGVCADTDAPGEFAGGAAVFDHVQCGGPARPEQADQ
jgi:hypothetical protein